MRFLNQIGSSMYPVLRSLPGFILCCMLTLSGMAQDAALDTSRVYELGPVVVTGTGVEVARKNLPLTISTVEESEIRRSSESNLLPILSGRVPGVFVTERGVTGFGVANGAAGQISIRGVGSSPNTQVLVLIDGHPQFMGLMGHPLADTYVASEAARVEVVRGPASILYGTGAMGGVINVITRTQHREGASASGRLSYGSYGTYKYSAGAGYRQGSGYVIGSLGHDRTDGHRPASDFDVTNGYLKAGVGLHPGLELTADAGLSSYKSVDPGPVTNPFPDGDHWVDIVRGRASVSLENDWKRSEGALRLFYSFGDHEIFDGFLSDDMNVGLMLYQGVHLREGTVVTLGADYKWYGGKAMNEISGIDWGEHHIAETAAYALLQQSLLDRIVIHAGVRLEDHSLYGTEAAPQVGLSLHVTEAVTVKGSVARGFRSPTIRELYLFPAPNRDLEPERMWNYETGLLILRPTWNMELTGFISEGSNLIQVEGRFPSLSTRNSGSFAHRGIEWEGGYRVSPSLRLASSYSYLHMDRPVTAAPAHQGFAEVVYTRGMVSLGVQARHIRELYSRVIPEPVKNSYTLLDAGLTLRPTRFLDVFVRGENLLDREYEINFAYPMPGAMIFTGIQVRY